MEKDGAASSASASAQGDAAVPPPSFTTDSPFAALELDVSSVPRADFPLDSKHYSGIVSRKHAQIIATRTETENGFDYKFSIEDFGSKNGSLINKRAVKSGGLKHGDVITFGAGCGRNPGQLVRHPRSDLHYKFVYLLRPPPKKRGRPPRNPQPNTVAPPRAAPAPTPKAEAKKNQIIDLDSHSDLPAEEPKRRGSSRAAIPAPEPKKRSGRRNSAKKSSDDEDDPKSDPMEIDEEEEEVPRKKAKATEAKTNTKAIEKAKEKENESPKAPKANAAEDDEEEEDESFEEDESSSVESEDDGLDSDELAGLDADLNEEEKTLIKPARNSRSKRGKAKEESHEEEAPKEEANNDGQVRRSSRHAEKAEQEQKRKLEKQRKKAERPPLQSRESLENVIMKPYLEAGKSTGKLKLKEKSLKFSSDLGSVEVPFKIIEHIVYHPARGGPVALIQVFLRKEITFIEGKPKVSNFIFWTESTRKSDDREEVDLHYQEFVHTVREKTKDSYSFTMDLRPKKKLIFEGCPKNSMVLLQATDHCVVTRNHTDPFFIIMLGDFIKAIYFERVKVAPSFDMVFVLQVENDIDVQIITQIPAKFLDMLQRWAVERKIPIYEGPANLKWDTLIDQIEADPEAFENEGGWEFLKWIDKDENYDGSDEAGDDSRGKKRKRGLDDEEEVEEDADFAGKSKSKRRKTDDDEASDKGKGKATKKASKVIEIKSADEEEAGSNKKSKKKSALSLLYDEEDEDEEGDFEPEALSNDEDDAFSAGEEYE